MPKQKPKILQVIRPSEGGIANHVITLSNGLSIEFDIMVACPAKCDLEEKISSAGIKTLPLPKKYCKVRI